MQVSFKPVLNALCGRIFGYHDVRDFVDEEVIISSEESFPLSKAIYLPKQLEDIVGTHDMAASLEDELNQLMMSELQNGEMKAYRIRNAVIGHDRVCTLFGSRDLSLRRARSRPVQLTDVVSEGSICSSWQGNDYFAHFLLDDLATYSLAKSFGGPFFAGGTMPRSQHCHDYMTLFDVNYVERRDVLVRNLWVFDDFALGASKRERLSEMAKRLSSNFSAPSLHPGAFVRRGSKGQIRELKNADEIESWCISQGFAIVDPEHQSVEEICATLHGVPIVIGVEGSQLIHAVFNMAKGGLLVCIQPADRFNVIFRHICAALSLHWGFVVAKGTVEGFQVDVGHVEEILEDFQRRSSVRNLL